MKSALTASVKNLVRGSYVGLGMASSASRLEPGFLLVGGQRCGTTSLFRALEQHPGVVRPTFNKGINYFDLNYSRGSRWYRSHFPTVASASRGHSEQLPIAFEASGYYMFHPLAPERIARDLPDVKIVAMLRDPIERAYSAWKHESARGFDSVSFEDAIDRELERTQGERQRMIDDPDYQSYAYRHYSYIARGHYSAQLREFTDRLPASNIHVVFSETFFEDPAAEFDRLSDFLGIERAANIEFDKHNARPSGPMPGASREKLAQEYEHQADELAALLGERPPWPASAADPAEH